MLEMAYAVECPHWRGSSLASLRWSLELLFRGHYLDLLKKWTYLCRSLLLLVWLWLVVPFGSSHQKLTSVQFALFPASALHCWSMPFWLCSIFSSRATPGRTGHPIHVVRLHHRGFINCCEVCEGICLNFDTSDE